MPSSNGSKTKSTRTKAKKATTQTAQAASTPADRARGVAQSVVDVPVGTVLEVSDRLSDLVEPFTSRAGAERKLGSYRTSLRRNVKRSERRGAKVRRKATTEARKTRNRVEREARKRRREVERNLRSNRREVEQRVRKAIDQQTARAQDLLRA